MVEIATPEFLSRLKALYPDSELEQPTSYVQSPWYAVAAITFSASNCPEAVPLVLQYVLKDLDAISASHEDRLFAVRKIRDGIFKSGMISGFPKAINALVSLYGATPQELQDKDTLRNPNQSLEDIAQAGQNYFNQTYGDTATPTQELLKSIYPDLGYYVTSFAYGYGYAYMGVTSEMETSFAMIAALIAIDTPRQIEWHLSGAVRNGATVAQVKGVRAIAIEISKAAGITWKTEIPDTK
ncbi:hypothetical protein HYDPIDRAFT_110552 [Hydnomerulius pinastri MD-312]|nr:hypothetical protein HYDPIDRAFT_110552 [Hydnomerulius pinastri MD-312]